jgi:hypothetical protein
MDTLYNAYNSSYDNGNWIFILIKDLRNYVHNPEWDESHNYECIIGNEYINLKRMEVQK